MQQGWHSRYAFCVGGERVAFLPSPSRAPHSQRSNGHPPTHPYPARERQCGGRPRRLGFVQQPQRSSISGEDTFRRGRRGPPSGGSTVKVRKSAYLLLWILICTACIGKHRFVYRSMATWPDFGSAAPSLAAGALLHRRCGRRRRASPP